MANAIIAYDKDLPEIPGRRPWVKPSSFLVKDAKSPTGWREDSSGRRASTMLLAPKIREAVDQWRADSYPGASDVARRLFEYWFEEDHEVKGFSVPFRYYFCQREAVETLVWLVEIAKQKDAQKLIRSYATIYKSGLFNKNIEFQKTADGQRQLVRYVPEQDAEGVQDLPPENLRRFAFKMATGSGKTWVMAMAMVYSRFHKLMVPKSELSTNFLIVAPNVIVFQRLERDFASNQIFYDLPLIPPEWRGQFSQKVILRDEAGEPDPSGNLVLTNIQQLYESRDQEWTPQNAVEALLGKKPNKDLAASGQRSMLERLKSLKDLVVINDEAHHVHDDDLAWNQSLLAIHEALPNGLSMWLDFSATPKDQRGMYFPWTICDYPLAQAVEDRIVKAPIIVTKEADPKSPTKEPENICQENVVKKYSYWIQAAVTRWKEHHQVYKKLKIQPVLFIMAEKTAYADVIGRYLWETPEFGFKESEVLVIHTDTKGEITKADLEKARKAAGAIDRPDNKVKAIVSVMMLREGWDVKNVTVVLGLRPFTADAQILPEQVVGRGLRLMSKLQAGPDQIQTLEVLGTRKLLDMLKTTLEAEGVGVASTKTDPPKPVIIEALDERLKYDIAIPLTKPSLSHDIRKIADLKVSSLEPIYDQKELMEVFSIRLKMEFATTETEVHQADIAAEHLMAAQEALVKITKQIIAKAGLPNRFSELYPLVRDYVVERCFGRRIDLENKAVQSNLDRYELQDGIVKYMTRKIAELTVKSCKIEFDRKDFKLSQTQPFGWRRNLPPLKAEKTVFNYVATFNDYERHFGEFLDRAKDIARFASLGTTEQGESGTQFRIDYMKPSGAIGFYYPDWVAVQKTRDGEVNWIIETKGRIWESTKAKDEAITDWCKRVSEATGARWQYVRVDQSVFDKTRWVNLQQLLDTIRGTLV